MKRLDKIHLKEQFVLDSNEMKKVFGGNSGKWCCISGECVGPMTNCSSAGCSSLYGSGASCQ